VAKYAQAQPVLYAYDCMANSYYAFVQVLVLSVFRRAVNWFQTKINKKVRITELNTPQIRKHFPQTCFEMFLAKMLFPKNIVFVVYSETFCQKCVLRVHTPF